MMWHDTRRFVQCARQAFELPAPVHEYGMATVGVAFVATENHGSPDAEDEGGIVADLPRTRPLDDLSKLPFADGVAGTVACLNVLQHVPEPASTGGEMIRLLRPGGILLVCSCGAGRPFPGAEPLRRPAPHALQSVLEPLGASLVGWQGREGDVHSVYAIGCKGPVLPGFLDGAARFLKLFRDALARDFSAIGWRERWRDWLARLTGRPPVRAARREYYHSQFVLHTPVGTGPPSVGAAGSPKSVGLRLDLLQ